MEKINVFLADWQVLFREGIHFTLSGEEDLVVTGETTNNEEALEFITANPPRIAIVNINHNDFSGIRLTRNIRQNLPLVSVVLVMDTDNIEQRYSALKCGAAACVTKDIDPEELVDLVRRIAGGEEPIIHEILRPEIAGLIMEEFDSFSQLNNEVDNLLASLSSRETEILRNVKATDTLQGLASALGIKEEAVNESLDIIRKKLEANEHCRDVVEASQKALSSVIKRTRRSKSSQEYITKEEFDAFRESIRELFRTFTDK